MDQKKDLRPVDWLRDSEKSISNRLSQNPIKEKLHIDQVSERMAALLLERLPPELASQMIAMLPEDKQEALNSLQQSAKSNGDASIGYTTFIERAMTAVGFEADDDTIHQIADAFLWGVVEEVPGDFKKRLTEVLPSELRSRMDLYSERENESKVA
jgi:hypothetical protein